ncbi:MAG TPA: PIN domain-containing protein [Gaiellaceae bacterium]|nr:PIN domain-containing protein [Gaiellaceae bacterium]
MIFVDTSFWLAQRLRRDSRHASAVALEERHGRAALTTSSAVLAETWTFLRRRADHGVAMRWLDRVLSAPNVAVARIDEELEDEAWAWLRVHDERPYSFVDATSFALMRRLGLRDALAFDGDFAAAGFAELRP